MHRIIVFIFFLFTFSHAVLSQVVPRAFDKRYMQTVFYDDFNGTSIDPDKWKPGLIHRGLGEMIYSRLTHKVSEGHLELTMVHSPDYNDSSNYLGAEFVTKETFLYGSFECKATLAQGTGSWPAFWSHHQQRCPENDGPEIDFAEFFARISNKTMGHYVHRKHAAPCGTTGKVTHPYSQGNDFIPATNTYTCYWTPEKIEFYIDSVLQGTYTRKGKAWWPSVPVAVIVSQQILEEDETHIVTPQTSCFHYVKVQQYFRVPEIAYPGVVYSPDSAMLDVSDQAYDITWMLAPDSLFTGPTSGTGKTACIGPSDRHNGTGEITWSFKMDPSGEIFSVSETFGVNGPRTEDISLEVYTSTGKPADRKDGIWLLSPNTTYRLYAINDGSTCSISDYSWTCPAAWTVLYTSQNMISIHTNDSPEGTVHLHARTGCKKPQTIFSGSMGTDGNCGCNE